MGHAALLLAIAVFAAAASWGVLLAPDFPNNHEGPNNFGRTEWFRRAFAAGDVWPTWTPFTFNGHGSPTPFFYHRLFFTVAGLLALPLGSISGTELCLYLFLVLGGIGMAHLGRTLGWPWPVQLSVGALFVFAPYAYTNWLIRGAFAEFAAAMLLPWLFLYGFRVMDGGRVVLGLGVVHALLFFAHVAIWLYAAPLVAGFFVAAAIRQWRTLRSPRAPLWWSAAWAVGLALSVNGPTALGVLRLERFYSLHVFSMFHPVREFQPWTRYLWDTKFEFGATWRGFSVEIGWILLATAAALLVVMVAARRFTRAPVARWSVVGVFLAAYFVLQLPVSAPIYTGMPFTDRLQFPWRLLVFITPLVLVLLGDAATLVVTGGGRWLRRGAFAVLGVAVFGQGMFGLRAQQIRYDWLTRARLEEVIAIADQPWAAGEFLPQGFHTRNVPPRTPFFTSTGCGEIGGLPREPVHFTRLELELDGRPCTLHFSQFVSPFIVVEGGATVYASRLRTHEIRIPEGTRRLVIRRRGLFETLRAERRYAWPPPSDEPWQPPAPIEELRD